MPKKTNWSSVVLGLGLMLGTSADLVPGDEVLGVPLGAFLVVKGFDLI